MLSLSHCITAGITALIACFPWLHVTIGAMLAFFPQTMANGRNEPPREIGFMFMGIRLAAVTAGWTFALGHFLVAGPSKLGGAISFA